MHPDPSRPLGYCPNKYDIFHRKPLSLQRFCLPMGGKYGKVIQISSVEVSPQPGIAPSITSLNSVIVSGVLEQEKVHHSPEDCWVARLTKHHVLMTRSRSLSDTSRSPVRRLTVIGHEP